MKMKNRYDGELLGSQYGPDWFGGSPAEATLSEYEETEE